ncbi:MAG: hypothetical protein M3237_17260 [Actinomycetota bacterium]|nr:hypothetical protein [Actinomycetota bacterium]
MGEVGGPGQRQGGSVVALESIVPTKLVRWLFGLLLVALPLEVAVAARYSEPFPALFGPAFEGSQEEDGVVHLRLSRVVLVTAGGIEREVESDVVLPESEALGAALLNSGYRSEVRANSAEARAWLTARLEEQFPDLEVTSVVVEWRRADYDIGSQEVSDREVEKTVRVDLEPSS